MKNRLYRVIKQYKSPYPVSIKFYKNEKVTIGNKYHDEEWSNWIRCFGANGKEAWCPEQFLEVNGTLGQFISDYDAKELTIEVGEVLEEVDSINGFILAKKATCEIGWAPKNHLVEQ